MSKKRKNKKNSSAARLLIVLILIFAALAAGAMFYLDNSGKPVDPGALDAMTVEIPSGSSTNAIGDILFKEGLIRSEFAFGIQSRISKNDGKFKAGFYDLSKSMSMKEIMAELLKGTAKTIRFTIPEGFDIRRTSERLSSSGLINGDEFLRQIEEGDFPYRFVTSTPAGRNRLEGYLYPDTYEVFSNATEEQIIDKMLSRFNDLFIEAYYERAAELGMDINQLVTMASIIEREAKVAEDRPVIASVFYNRLKIGMPLQSCATVQYILGEQKEKLTNSDIAIDSPYNTYRIAGLPPGPICSPGIESIKAALYPADTDYLYFLAKGDGSHVFSVTYEDFLKNKKMYID